MNGAMMDMLTTMSKVLVDFEPDIGGAKRAEPRLRESAEGSLTEPSRLTRAIIEPAW
jgi:hypothetical protein